MKNTPARELPQREEQQDSRCGVKQDVSKMMSPGLESVKLAIQHVGNGGEWMPVGCMHMGESPCKIPWRETVQYFWVGVNVRTIVVIHELVMKGLAKHDPDNDCKQNADSAGD